MTFDAAVISRIVRGVAGLAMVTAGIIYGSWIGILGAFLLLGAFGGGCYNGSCSVRQDKE